VCEHMYSLDLNMCANSCNQRCSVWMNTCVLEMNTCAQTHVCIMDGYVRKLMNSLDMNIEINMYSLEMKMNSFEINMCARTHTRIESVDEPVVVECDTTHVSDTYIRTHI